jgi:hypothetical protein
MKKTVKGIALLSSVVISLTSLSFIESATAAEKTALKISKPAITKYQRYIYRYQNGVMQRKSIDGKFVSTDTRKESAFDPIRVAAYKSVMQSIANKNSSNLNVKYVIRPNYPTVLSASIKLSFDKVAKQFGDYFPAGTPVTVVMITEKDKDFIQKELPSIVDQNATGDAWQIASRYLSKSEWENSSASGGGSAGFFKGPEQSKGGFYLSHTASYATMETYWPEVAPHEFAHILQGVFEKDLSFSSREEYQKKLPQHYVEGSANTLGHILAYPNLGWYSDDADLTIKRYSNGVKRWKPVNTKANMISLLEATEKSTPDQAFDASYSIGQLFYEWLIGTYGFDDFILLIKNIGQTSSFDENMKTTYGITKAQAYEKAAPYMLRAWKKATK